MNKLLSHIFAIVTVLTLCGPAAGRLGADDSQADASQAKNSFTGVVTIIDHKDKTFSVKKALFTKKFNLAKDCLIILPENKSGDFADILAGNRVDVAYQSFEGVMVANQIKVQEVKFTGYLTSIDKDKNLITVKNGMWGSKTFKMDGDSKLVFKDKGNGSQADLKLGHKVYVSYESGNGVLKVLKLEQNSLDFEGVISAIDTSTKVIKAKSMLTEKKFILANDCRIIVAGKNSKLTDLRTGQSAVISYEDINGVNITDYVNQSPETATSAKNNLPQSNKPQISEASQPNSNQ